MRALRRSDLRVGAAIALFWAAAPSLGHAADTLPDLSACQPLAACIAMLDRVVPAEDTGALPRGADAAATQLSRFGEPAKVELLKRAQGSQPGWRNYAGAILANWPTWSDQDVPALSAALALDHGGWIARSLAVLGDDRAIDALIADLPDAGTESQTGWALIQLAPKSLTKLLPLLELDTQDPRGSAALGVITNSKDRARPLVPVWTGIAADKAQPPERRLAALRALRAAASVAVDAGAALRPLLTDPTPTIAAETRETLLALGDPAVATEAVSACVPSDQRLSSLDLPDGSYCLLKLTRFRASPDIIGPRLLEFTNSHNGAEAALAIGVIAQVGYQPAEPRLIAALSSPDWRVTYAAAAALGVLGLPNAAPALEETSRTHWLPEVRRQAQQSLDAIKAGTHLQSKTTWELVNNGISDVVTEDEANHSCKTWRWRGQSISPPLTVLRSVQFKTGKLTAIDQGEWGGGLDWSPSSGTPQPLLKDNVSSLVPIEGGALALAGLAHMSFNYGYVVRARQTTTGWDVQEVARLPGRFSAISAIAPDSYAAWSFRRVVIFSEHGILGLAECER